MRRRGVGGGLKSVSYDTQRCLTIWRSLQLTAANFRMQGTIDLNAVISAKAHAQVPAPTTEHVALSVCNEHESRCSNYGGTRHTAGTCTFRW